MAADTTDPTTDRAPPLDASGYNDASGATGSASGQNVSDILSGVGDILVGGSGVISAFTGKGGTKTTTTTPAANTNSSTNTWLIIGAVFLVLAVAGGIAIVMLKNSKEEK